MIGMINHGYGSGTAMTSSSVSLFCWGDLQVIGYAKSTGYGFGANPGKILVGFTVDNAFQSDLTALDDDSYGLLHSQGVFLKARIAVNSAIESQTNPIV
jgi:hypothetical protein